MDLRYSIVHLEIDLYPDIISKLTTNDAKTTFFTTTGLLTNMDNTLHVITNFDSVRHAPTVFAILYSKRKSLKIALKHVYSSMELGLSLMQVVDLKPSSWPHYDKVCTMDTINPEHMTNDFPVTINTISHTLTKGTLTTKLERVNTKITSLIFENKYTKYYPKLPFYTLEYNDENIRKYIGAVVTDGKQSCVGIINDYNETYRMIPAVSILKCLKRESLCSLPISDLVFDENKILYSLPNKRKCTFKTKDVLHAINGKVISDNKLYSLSMRTHVPVDTYIALDISDKMNVSVMRKGSLISKNITTRSCSDIHFLPLFEEMITTMLYKDLIFVTLTYELLQQILQLVDCENINVESYVNKFRNKTYLRPVMLLKMDKKLKNVINSPFVHVKKDTRVELLVLKTINGTNVSNLNSLKKHIDTDTNSFVFTNGMVMNS